MLVALVSGSMWITALTAQAVGETFKVISKRRRPAPTAHSRCRSEGIANPDNGAPYTMRTVATVDGLVYHERGGRHLDQRPRRLDALQSNISPTAAIFGGDVVEIAPNKQLRVDLTLERPMGTVLYAWTLVVDGCNTGQIRYNGLTSAIGPTVTSFTPASGPVGTSVTLTGTNLSPVTSVTFGGAVAGVISELPTQTVTTVPLGAVTGPIVVTTPTGTFTSVTNFTVTGIAHPRDLTLSVGRKAKGKVTVDDGYSACAEDVLVRVQRRKGGGWKLVGTDRTSDAGRFVVLGTSNPGRYRAVAKRATLASSDVCLKAVSPVITH